MNRRIGWLIFAYFAIALSTYAQQQSIPLERHFYHEIQRTLFHDSTATIHMGMRPGLLRRVNTERTFGYQQDSAKYYYWATSRLFRDHMVEIQEGDFRCTIDPLFDLNLGWDLLDTSGYSDTTQLYTNSRGILIQADIGKSLSFQSGFIETQAFLPAFQREWIATEGIAPGMGRAKVFKGPGFDYGLSFGTLSYSPSERWNFQLGYGKHFIGYGHRSLLLSDAAFNYPFLKAQSQWWEGRIEYTTIFAVMQNLTRLPLGEVPEALFQRKAASLHYLSLKIAPQWEIGLFEGTIWQRWKENEGMQPLPVFAYTPVIGTGLLTQGWDGIQNVVAGLNTRAMLFDRVELYGQLVLDEPGAQRTGYQAGIKWYNLGIRNLDVQVEWNSTGDYLYAHRVALQSFSNHNQPLGHPSGGGVEEALAIVNYRYNRWMVQVKGNLLQQTSGPAGNWSANPEAAVTADNPPGRSLTQVETAFSYFMNPKTNARLVLGYTYREEEIDGSGARRSGYLFAGLRMSVLNRYFDF